MGMTLSLEEFLLRVPGRWVAITMTFSFFYLCLSKNGPCRYDPKNSAANVTGFVRIPVSEAALMNAVATVGPVSVGIDSHHYSFRFYSGGKCSSFL